MKYLLLLFWGIFFVQVNPAQASGDDVFRVLRACTGSLQFSNAKYVKKCMQNGIHYIMNARSRQHLSLGRMVMHSPGVFNNRLAMCKTEKRSIYYPRALDCYKRVIKGSERADWLQTWEHIENFCSDKETWAEKFSCVDNEFWQAFSKEYLALNIFELNVIKEINAICGWRSKRYNHCAYPGFSFYLNGNWPLGKSEIIAMCSKSDGFSYPGCVTQAVKFSNDPALVEIYKKCQAKYKGKALKGCVTVAIKK